MAVVLLLAGVLLPPAWLADTLRGGVPAPTGLVAGLWLLKLLLVAHAIAVVALQRWLPRKPARPSAPTGNLLPVVALLAVGLVLRLPGLGDGLWYDEIQTLVDYVRQPIGLLVTTFDSTNQHLLYSVSARIVTVIAGESALALRLPAVLFGVASLWAAVAFGRRWLPTREAWWAAIILAVSYHHVWFSQNARGYTGLLLGTLAATALMSDLLRSEHPTRGRVWGYAIAMALTVVTHVTALVVVAAHGLVWLLRTRRAGSPRQRWAPLVAMLLAGTVALACYAPVLPQLVEALGSSGTSAPGVAWQRPGWFIAEAVTGLVRGIPAGIVVVPLAGLVVLVGLADAVRRDRTLAALMVLPMVIMTALLLATGHNLWPRFFFFGAGFVVQWAVHGGFVILDRLVPRSALRLGDAGLALVTIGSLFLLPRAWAAKQDYRAADAWLTEHALPGDRIVATEMMELPMNRWLGHDWPVARDAAALDALESAEAATWLLYTFPIRLQAVAPDLWQRIGQDYAIAHVVPASINGGEIVIVKR